MWTVLGAHALILLIALLLASIACRFTPPERF